MLILDFLISFFSKALGAGMAGYKTLERLGHFSAEKSSLLYGCYLLAGWGIRQFQGSEDLELFFLFSSL